jgi:catechol 2,3-dioxygenase-like lactoylglutathione lyase family enzyme
LRVDRRAHAERFLVSHGAEEIEHPGGTLLAHLRRVADQLAAWGASEDLVLAGLCHATYGTDGFGTALLPLRRRADLVNVIGAAAESVVYRYASCDRGATYPTLGGTSPMRLRDRFTGEWHDIDPKDFLVLTAANELDVVAHNGELATRSGPALLDLFARTRRQLPQEVWAACQLAFGPVAISHLDHLVLTVANLDRTIDFYRRVLGMTPVEFGDGRHALEFGTSKINLHVAGQELPPHALRPVPGSADICLVAATALPRVIAQLRALDVPLVDGPVVRTGARGEMDSVYVRDPDGNLIEISNYRS